MNDSTNGASHNLSTEELLALLRDASLKDTSIVEEIECAGAQPPPIDQLLAARALLEKLRVNEGTATEVCSLPELLALAAVRAAGEAGRQDVLVEVAKCTQKPLVKEAKRELQRLKQKGVKVADVAPQGAPVLKAPPKEPEPPCHVSSIDAFGERAVWYARNGRGGVELIQVVLSDVKGILAVDALALSKRHFRDFVKKMPRGGVVSTAEVPREHARALIAHAAEQGARNGFAPPPAYGHALALLGPAPDPLPPLPGESIQSGADGDLAHQLAGAALFADPLFSGWIPEEQDFRTFAARVDDITQSQLYVDETQKRAAIERTADESAEAYFTPQRKARYARRLFEMAFVLKADGRDDAARTAASVARALAGQGGSAQSFCRALFLHALEATRTPTPADAAPEQVGTVRPDASTSPGGLIL